MQIVSGADFDAAELCRHVKKVEDCKRLLKDSRNETRAAKGFAKQIVKVRSGFVVSEAVLYKENVLTVLRRQVTLGFPQDVLFSSQNVSKHDEHPVAALYGKDTERNVRKKVVGSASRDVWYGTVLKAGTCGGLLLVGYRFTRARRRRF